jgi:hypothetical protein
MEPTQKQILDFVHKICVDELRLDDDGSAPLLGTFVAKLTLVENISFHEAQSLIYNTMVEHVDLFFQRIAMELHGTKHPRQEFVKRLVEVIDATFYWVAAASEKIGLDKYQIKESDIVGEKILSLYKAYSDDAATFRQQIDIEWDLLTMLQPDLKGSRTDGFYTKYQANLVRILLGLSPAHAMRLFRKFFEVKRDPSQYDSFSTREILQISGYFGTYLWDFNLKQWTELIGVIDSKKTMLYIAEFNTISPDFLEAMIRKYGPEIVKYEQKPIKWHSTPTMLRMMYNQRDFGIMIRLIELLWNDEMLMYVANKLSKLLDHELLIIHRYNMIEGDIDPKATKRLEKVAAFLHRIPMIKNRIIRTRRKGGISAIEENFLEFLDFDPYSWEDFD